jgi:hypothetical protein
VPRIRTIKPELPEDEKLGECSRDARLLFILVWTICDDHGRFRAAPVYLRTRLFPYDMALPEDVDKWLGELAGIRRVKTYEVDGERYGQVVNWAKHQRVDNAGKPLYPDPPTAKCGPPPPAATRGEPPRTPDVNYRDNTKQGVHETRGESPQDSAGLSESPLDLGPRTTTKDLGPNDVAPTPSDAIALVPDVVSPPATAQNDVRVVFDAWCTATNRTDRTRLDDKRRRVIAQALKSYPVDDLVDAVRGWRHSTFHTGTNENRRVYNDLSLLLRDSEHIERFRDLERYGPERVNGTRPKSFDAISRVIGTGNAS